MTTTTAPRLETLPWVDDDGGRADAGFKGDTGDCVTRAIAIATGLPYRQVYDMVNATGERIDGKKYAARLGPSYAAVHDLMVQQLGWRYQAAPPNAHLTPQDMPDVPVFIADLRRSHFVAVIDGTIHDTWNATSRHGNGRLERVACLWLPPADFTRPSARTVLDGIAAARDTTPDDAVPAVTGEMTAERARLLTDEIKADAEALWDKLAVAYTERAWAALGYRSWDDYCAQEFAGSRLRLPREERREVVCSLRESGLSIRAIAAATGADAKTVQSDLKSGVGNSHTSEEPVEVEFVEDAPGGLTEDSPGQTDRVAAALAKAREVEATPITGTDGKTYPAKPKPSTPAAAPNASWEPKNYFIELDLNINPLGIWARAMADPNDDDTWEWCPGEPIDSYGDEVSIGPDLGEAITPGLARELAGGLKAALPCIHDAIKRLERRAGESR